MPRFDKETGAGLVSDVCLKRKIRDYVETKFIHESLGDRYKIYVSSTGSLEEKHLNVLSKFSKADLTNINKRREAADLMCDNFYDIRTFGAVLSVTDRPATPVRGPVQITFARSVDPITYEKHTITRICYTKENKAQSSKGTTEMGGKYTIPYGLYIANGFVLPTLAEKTNFNYDDLNLLWEAILNMFELDKSSSRGLMNLRKLIVFKHENKLGKTSFHELEKLVSIEKKEDVEFPRNYSDYSVVVKYDNIPDGIEIIEMR